MKQSRRWFGIAVLAMAASVAIGLFRRSPARPLRGVDRLEVETPSGGSTSYLQSGTSGAPRILYIHGSPGDAKGWKSYLIDPIHGYESISVDRIGFGMTRLSSPEPSLKAQAAAIAPLLEKVGAHWPIVVGHSLGATIACRLAADFPDRVRGLVLVSNAIDPDLERPKWYNRIAEFGFVPRILPRDLVISNRELLPLHSELAALTPLLARITCAVAIVHGEKDWLTPIANAAYAKARLTGAEALIEHIEPQESHFVIWTRPELIRQTIGEIAEATE
ncbi:MAG: hypothetical protein AMXMBFR84_31850 [Candidatus Hydrogenedentota bacterium]